MTYGELKQKLDEMTEKELLMTVTVYDNFTDEFIGIDKLLRTDSDCDVLDENHPVLISVSQ